MTMPFTPCDTSGTITQCGDVTVNILQAVFGDIIWVLAKGLDPNTATGGLLAKLFGFFNSGLLVVGSLIVTYVAVMGAINTANDGEAMGKSWSSVWTPVRIVAGGAVLLPSASGYSFIQMLVLMISMWGIGFANGIYKLAIGTSVFQPAALVASSDQPGSYYGMRDFARQYLAASYCKKAATAIYTDDLGTPAIGNKGAPDKTSVTGGRSDATYNLADRNVVTNLGGGEPICGTYTITTYVDPGVYTDDSNTQKALQQLRTTLNGHKRAAVQGLMADIDAWVVEIPADINKPGFNLVQSARFNTIVKAREDQILAAMSSQFNGDATVANGVGQFVDALNKEGWSMAGGWYQRVGLLRTRLATITGEAVATATEPSLSGLPADARAQLLKGSLAAVTEAIAKKSENAGAGYQSSGVIKPEDIASMLPKDKDSETNVGAIANDVGIKLSMLVNGAMKSATDAAIGSGDPSKKVDAVSRMKLTGDVLSSTRLALWTAEMTLKTVMTTTRVVVAGVGAVSVAGFRVDGTGVTNALWDWVMTVPVPILATLASYVDKLAFYFGVLLPSLPYTIFMITVVGWVLAVFQSVIAAPLWAIMHMRPSQSFVGSETQGYLLLLALFVRPALAIIGLMAAMLIADPMVDYIAKAFFAMRGDVVASTGLLGAVAQFYTFFWWMTVFGMVLLPVLYMIFGLPQILPDHVLQWIGAGLSDLGATGASQKMQQSAGEFGGRLSGPRIGGGGGGSGGGGSGSGSGGGGGGKLGNASGGGGGGGAKGGATPVSANPQGVVPSQGGGGAKASAGAGAGAGAGKSAHHATLGQRLSDGAGAAMGRAVLQARVARAGGASVISAGRESVAGLRQEAAAGFRTGADARVAAMSFVGPPKPPTPSKPDKAM